MNNDRYKPQGRAARRSLGSWCRVGLAAAVMLLGPVGPGGAADKDMDWRFLKDLIGNRYAVSGGVSEDWNTHFYSFDWVFPGSLAIMGIENAAGERTGYLLIREIGERRFAVAGTWFDAAIGYAHPDGSALTIISDYHLTLRAFAGGRRLQFINQSVAKDLWQLHGGWSPVTQVSTEEYGAFTSRMKGHSSLPEDSPAGLAEEIGSAVARIMAVPRQSSSDVDGDSVSASGAQTPAGAQAFLGMLAGQGRVSVEAKWNRDFGWNQFESVAISCDPPSEPGSRNCTLVKPARWAKFQQPEYRVSQAEPAETTCKSLVWAELPQAEELVGSTSSWVGGVIPPFVIDWSKVSQVRQDAEMVVVSTPWPNPQHRFDVGEEGIAARLAFAMEFLRVHCDETAGTGF